MHRKVKVALVVLGVLVVLLVIARAQVPREVTRARRTSQDQLSADWTRWAPDITADTALWKDHELFAPRDGGDASALLFAHVRWDSTDGGAKVGSGPVPEDVEQRLRAWAGDFAQHAGDAGVETLDFAWLADLSSMAAWDIEPIGGPLDAVPFSPFYEPVPHFIDVRMLAKARLLHGLANGSQVGAAAEVRELARLCFTTEHLLGEMTGVALLGIERRAHDEAVKRGLDVAGWTPVSEADQQRLRRVLWVAKAPTSLVATGQVADARLPFGRCAALREGLLMAHFLRRYLEQELPERYAMFTTALAKDGCRLRRARTAWAANSPEGQLPVSTKGMCAFDVGASTPAVCSGLPDVPVNAVPFARSFIGSRLVSNEPDWFKLYRSP